MVCENKLDDALDNYHKAKDGLSELRFKFINLEKEVKKKDKQIEKLEAKVESKENKIRKYMESIDSEVEEQVGQIIIQRDEAVDKYDIVKANLEKADARILKLRENNE